MVDDSIIRERIFRLSAVARPLSWRAASALALADRARTFIKDRGIVSRVILYWLLINTSFILLYPLIYMLSTSLMTLEDFNDPSITWVPIHFVWRNFIEAFNQLKYPEAFVNSSIITLTSAIGQVLSCSLIGYGFARIKFPGRDFLFFLVILIMIVPPQTIIVSLFILYSRLKWIGTYWPFIAPSFFGFGMRGALFIFIFRQFFKGFPWELEEAARVDGAGTFGIYWRIMLPLSKPAIITVFLFSFVWHWNDYYEPMMYLETANQFTLMLRLNVLWATQVEGNYVFSQVHIMAACLLVILPSLILYLFTQRFFVESIERTGLRDH
ncbi:MAG: carbohydrate ABC transporter permease [bacterium]